VGCTNDDIRGVGVGPGTVRWFGSVRPLPFPGFGRGRVNRVKPKPRYPLKPERKRTVPGYRVPYRTRLPGVTGTRPPVPPVTGERLTLRSGRGTGNPGLPPRVYPPGFLTPVFYRGFFFPPGGLTPRVFKPPLKPPPGGSPPGGPPRETRKNREKNPGKKPRLPPFYPFFPPFFTP